MQINMTTIRECFDVILSGNQENSRLAAREVSKILYSSRDDKNKYKDIKQLVDDAPRQYLEILEEWRQKNFVSAISVIYFLHGRDKQPDFLLPWLLELLSHPSGTIRYASVRMIENELGPLSVHIRFPDYKSGDIKPERSDQILKGLFICLILLSDKFWNPKYKKYKHVDALPASPYKSAQMILAKMRDLCGDEYMKELEMDFAS